MVLRTEGLRVGDATRTSFPTLIEALESADAAEGVRAFREKRKPIWRAS
jgi:crotonobetainyl-CoA hydratase